MIVATAGHIDHGKTTLMRALTGIDTDALPEEKARGISIDLGFAHMDLPGGGIIGFVDVPGHERFIRNMLSGVYAVGHVLLVVAADDGVMPQTAEHLAIVGLLGVAGGTVVITKADRAEPARIAQVQAEVRALLADAGCGGFGMVTVSAVTGAGIDGLKARLAEVAATERRATGAGGLARFVVDRVFVAQGSGTVVRGTVIAGDIAPGETLTISPAGLPARVRRLQRHGRAADRAQAGERCAINLAGIDHTAVARGDWLVAPAAHRPTDRIDIRLRVLPSEAGALKHWTPVHLHIGAADIPARLALRRGEALAPGQEGLAQLRLSRPVQAAAGDRLILRDQSSTRTIGGGAVVNPFPPRRRAERAAVLAALDGRGVAEGLAALLDTLPGGVGMGWFAALHNLTADQATALLPPDAVRVKATAFSAQQVERLGRKAAARVERFHAETPAAPGMDLRRLHAETARALPFETFQDLARQSARGWGLDLSGSQLRRADHDPTQNPQDERNWRLIHPILDHSGFHIPSARELAEETRIPLAMVRDLMHRKAATGALVRLTAERFTLPHVMEAAAEKAAAAARRIPGGQFKAADFRDEIGTGRTIAIEILECLDRLGRTVRQGDRRGMAPEP